MNRITILALSTALLAAPTVSSANHGEMTSTFVESFDGTLIDINVCRPAGADASNPVPVVLQSHGWGGQKSDCSGRDNYFNAGIGFVSMTQRGNTGSGGENNVMDPDFEGRDISAVLDHIASLDWVLKDDGPGGIDPVVGGLGGSYGGGFQWVGAFTDQWLRDAPTRFNSLRPGNTWYDLRESLAPNGVMRSVIVGGLYAGGVRNNNLAPWVHAAMASAVATGVVVDGPEPLNFGSELHQHSSAWFVEQGMKLDIPVYLSQGAADLVFNLTEGLDNFQQALTPAAQEKSIFISDQGGHNIPGQVPSGPVPYTPRGDDACDGIGEVDWFKHTLLGEPLDLDARYRLTTTGGDCLEYETSLPSTAQRSIETLEQAILPTGARGPARFDEVAEGPVSIAGIPTLEFTATTSDPDARIFWGIALGTSPDDAQLVGGQWIPTRIQGPTLDQRVSARLGGIAVRAEVGEKIYLVSAPATDQYLLHPSRTLGAVLVSDATLGLPGLP